MSQMRGVVSFVHLIQWTQVNSYRLITCRVAGVAELTRRSWGVGLSARSGETLLYSRGSVAQCVSVEGADRSLMVEDNV